MSNDHITIRGNLTGDPELRYTQSGLAVANFTIAATDRTFDRKSNDWKDGDTIFHRSSVWREFAEQVAGSLTKGMAVIAVGKQKQRSYETKDGEKRQLIEFDIDSIGPDLKNATAVVTRVTRTGSPAPSQQSTQAEEPWAASTANDSTETPF